MFPALVWVLLFLNMALTAYSKITEREKITLIRNFDIPEQVLDTTSIKHFWKTARDNSPSYKTAFKIAESGKARSVQRRIGEEIVRAKENYITEEYPYNLIDLLDKTIRKSGILDLYPGEAKLYLDPSEYASAYTLPDGSVYISYGMIKRMDYDPDLIMAVYAKQLSHFVCQHSFLYLYRSQRRLLRKKVMNEIFSIITLGASKYADLKFAEMGIATSLSRNVLDLTRASRREISRKAIVDKMIYGRDLEFESDIIAYRFIEKAGINPDCYIEMLSRLKSDIEIFSKDESLHPLTVDRIELIETLKSNPDLKIKVKASEDDIYGYE